MSLSKSFATGIKADASSTSITSGAFNSTGFTHLVIFVKHEGATTTITPSDNAGSTGWASLTKQGDTGSGSWGQFHWVKIGTPGASHTVTATFGAARNFRGLLVWLVNATTGVIVLDDESTANGGTTAVDAGSLDTTGVSVVSFMGVAESTEATFTQGTGWSEDFDTNTYGQSRGPETTSPIDPVCTCDTVQDWAACAASFREGEGPNIDYQTDYQPENPQRNRRHTGRYS